MDHDHMPLLHGMLPINWSFGSKATLNDLPSQLDQYAISIPNMVMLQSFGREVVAYFSRKLLPREEKFSTIEKECLAIKLACQAFCVYILGREFTIQTDHRALEWLNKLKENNARLTRWSLALQPFQFTVRHRAGVANKNADALSCAPCVGATG